MNEEIFWSKEITPQNLRTNVEQSIDTCEYFSADFWIRCIGFVEKSERFEDAAALGRKAQTLHPENLEICSRLMALLTRLGLSSEALEVGFSTISRMLPPKAAPIAFATSEALQTQSRRPEALIFLSAARQLDPSNSLFRRRLVRDLIAAEMFDAAGEELLKQLELPEFYRDAEAVAAVLSNSRPEIASQLAGKMRSQPPNWSFEQIYKTKYKFLQSVPKDDAVSWEVICGGHDSGAQLKPAFVGIDHPISRAIPWMPMTSPIRLAVFEKVYLHVFFGGFLVTDENGDPLNAYTLYLFDDFIDKLRDRRKSARELGRIFWAGDIFGSNNYCHWFVDYLPRIIFGAERFPDYRLTIARDWASGEFQNDSLDLCGIGADRLLKVDEGSYYVEQLALLTSSGRDYVHCFQGGSRDYAMQTLRTLPAGGPRAGRRLHLIRRKGLGRGLENSDEVTKALSKHGFEEVNPGELKLREQVKLFGEAEVIIGAHGAALTNILFCGRGTKILEFLPPNSGSPAFTRLALLRNLEYSLLLGSGSAPGSPIKTVNDRANFYVNPESVLSWASKHAP